MEKLMNVLENPLVSASKANVNTAVRKLRSHSDRGYPLKVDICCLAYFNEQKLTSWFG